MIKIFDPSTDGYKVVASNRGDGLYTKSIDFTSATFDASVYEDNDPSIVTIDEALYQLKKEIRETKEGVAWVYKNGTIGGGGGGGGSFGNISFKVESPNFQISDGQIIVNNGADVPLNFSIKGSSIGRKMIITIRDKKGNIYDGYRNATYVVSSKSTTITIPKIEEDTYIEFSGYDSETLTMIETYTLNIKVAALKVTGPTSAQISQSDEEYIIEYSIKTTAGQITTLMLSTNIEGIDYTYNHNNYFTNDTKIAFNVFDIFVDKDGNKLDLYNAIQRGAATNFTITAKVTAGSYNSECSTSVVVTDPRKITVDIIPLDNISSVIKDDGDDDYYVQIDKLPENTIPRYNFIENNNIIFNVKLYFTTQEFRMYYELYQFDDNGNPYTLYKKGNIDNYIDISNQPTGTTYYNSSTTITIPYMLLEKIDAKKPIFVYIKAWDKVDPVQYSGEVTKWFGILNDATWMAFQPALSGGDAYDGFMNYLYYYWNSYIPMEIPGNTWLSERDYQGSLITSKRIKGNIKYYNCNNITNGLVLRGSGIYDNNIMRLSSNAYATILDNSNLDFNPLKKGADNWMYDSNGWTMSFLVKSDIQPNTDNVIISYANYDAEDNFTEGIYITTEDVKIVLQDTTGDIKNFNLTAKLAQDTLNQIDIVFRPGTEDDTKASLKLYVNGVLASAGISKNGYFEYNNSNKKTTNIDGIFTFAAKNSLKSGISKFSDTNFYRIMFYKRWLSDFHITKNYIQGQAEVNLLEDGTIDKATNNELRQKNFFFDINGICALIDDSTLTGECSMHEDLYTTLANAEKKPLPIVCVNIEDTVGDTFRNVVNNRYSEDEVAADKKKGEAEKTITKKYQASFEIIPAKSSNKFEIGAGLNNSVTNDFANDGFPWITLQGTSTLGYRSKNFQIGFGYSDTRGNHLVQAFEDMLPENEYILKADVMDSGHANNAAIGKFINDFLESDETLIRPTVARSNDKNMYAKQVKHTTLGHPCILFVRFKGTENPTFMGIYSFNLGRISYYNLGYNVFDGYYKVSDGAAGSTAEYQVEYDNNNKVTNPDIKFPAYVSTYKAIPIPYTSDLTGIDPNYSTAVCYECNKNDNAVGSFQQYNFIDKFYDRVYPDVDDTNTARSFDNFRKIFVATANMFGADPDNEYTSVTSELINGAQRSRCNLLRDVEGKFKLKGSDEYELFDIEHYNAGMYEEFNETFDTTDQWLTFVSPQSSSAEEKLNAGLIWDHASAYFVLAMLFGLTDSLGKNLNIRSFDQKSWYTSFYDMDTGLALTNSGNETVKKDAYLDVFTNKADGKGFDVKINGYTSGGYDTFNSRLWNIVRFLTNTYPDSFPTAPTVNYRKIWESLRKGMLQSPDNFINNYYIEQNKTVGEIIFNQDYYTKYIQDEIDKIDNPKESAISSIALLHGNRINFVKDWFTKHVYFLDGVFDLGCQDTTKSETSRKMYGNYAANNLQYGGNVTNAITPDYTVKGENAAPYTVKSDQSDRVNPPSSGYRTFTVKSNFPMFFTYANSTNGQRLYVPENKETQISLNLIGGNEQTMSYNFVPYLTKFDKLSNMFYVTMKDIQLKSLTELDLSNMSTLSGAEFNIASMIELRKLNMENVRTHSGTKLSVNLSNAKKINYINLRNSDVNSLILPGEGINPGGSLETLLIDGTTITNIDLTNQAMLSTFSAAGCNVLDSVKFNNNPLLKSVGSLPQSLSTLIIDECSGLESVQLVGMINLEDYNVVTNKGFSIGKVPSLKSFSYTASTEDGAKYLTKMDLSGATALETLELQGFHGDYVTLAYSAKQTLKSVNFSNSNIKYIIWKDNETNKSYYSYAGKTTDLSVDTFVYENVFDFSECPNFTSFNLSKTSVKYIILNNKTFNIDNTVLQCENLERIIGNISISNADMIKTLKSFKFNEVARLCYDSAGIAGKDKLTNIILNYETGDFSVASLTDSEFSTTKSNDETKIYHNINNLVTNFTFNVKNAKELCKDTQVNITDMYAVLLKLGESIDALESTFENCRNIHCGYGRDWMYSDDILKEKYAIEKAPLLETTFIKNKNVKVLKNTFKNTDINWNVGGQQGIYNPTLNTGNNNPYNSWAGKNIFLNLPKLEEVNNIFTGAGIIWIFNDIFNITNDPNDNNIRILKSPFNPETYSGSDFDFGRFFACMPNIEDIEEVFYGTNISMGKADGTLYKTISTKTLGDIKVCTIFYNNPKLKIINRWMSTRNSAIDYTTHIDLADIFGGVQRWLYDIGEIEGENGMPKNITINGKSYNIDTTYPRNIEKLDNALSVSAGTNNKLPVLDWKYMDKLFYNVKYDNSYNSCLVSCANIFQGNPKIYNDTTDPYMINKDGEFAEFPKDIFNISLNGHEIKFSNLENVSGMFEESMFKNTLDFPGNIFKNCTCQNGLNISKFLANTSVMPINLVSVTNSDYECFKNCKLINVDSLFENCCRTLTSDEFVKAKDNQDEMLLRFDNGGVRSVIPYKFFYMENSLGFVNSSIKSMKNVFKNCNWMGCRADYTNNEMPIKPRYNQEEMFYITKRPSLSELNEILAKSSFSAKELGTLVDKNDLGVYEWDPWSYDGTLLSVEYTDRLTGDVLNKISENSGKTTSGKSYLDVKYETLVDYVDYPKYENGIEKSVNDILSENAALNTAYIGKYEEVLVKDSSVWRIYYDADKDSKYINWDESPRTAEQNYTIWGMGSSMKNLVYNTTDQLPTFFVRNYMVPMDIFRYSVPDCEVEGIFEDLSRFNRTDRIDGNKKLFNYGIIGRIPPKIFYPLNNVSSLKRVFYGCKGVTPYAQSLDGQFYRFMFNNNLYLKSLEHIFSGITILGSLSSDFIKTNKSLETMEGIFKNGFMIYDYSISKDYKNFITSDMFENQSILGNLSSAFAKDDTETDDSHLYFDIYDIMLNISNNPALKTVNNIFYNQNGMPKSGSKTIICPFHDFGNIDYMNAYYGTGYDLKSLGLTKEILEKYGINS